MYQGKFDQKRKKSSVSVQEIVASRNSAPAKATPAKESAAKKEAPAKASTARKTSNPAPAKKQPARQSAPQPAPAPAKRGPRLGGVIFYTIYFLFIFLFFVGTFFGLQWLNGWLADYEAAQPTTKCQEVFDQLFSNPDWAALYEQAGVEDTAYEGKEQYVAYMENKVGTSDLTFMETSAGLSGDKKYLVKLGEEKIASFTLVGESKYITDIPDWQLGKIELFFEREESYLIQKMDGHTAYVNGIPLDDSFTIQIATTKAEDYLPIGATGVRTCVQQISGLMGKPEVTVCDKNGEQMDVSFDEEKGMFIEQTEANTITDEQKDVALGAAKAYALYMINKASRADVAKYFNASSDIYSIIVKSELWMVHADYGHNFSDEVVSDYCRYADDLFSVKVALSMNVTRSDGSVKQYPFEQTFFFALQSTGKWLAYDMTNENVQEPVGQVRLTFMDGKTVLNSDFFDTDSHELLTPVVSAPEGKVFSGWVREDVDENGSTTLTVVFTPDATGLVTLSANSTLEPMTLYAYFEDIQATEGAE